MARAYDILGFRAHHGLDMPSLPSTKYHAQWALLERAAESTWPDAHGVRFPAPRRFEREDWDKLFGEYDVVTDIAAIFAQQLVLCYPDARVVVVQREFGSWWKSFEKEVVEGLFNPFAGPFLWILSTVTGRRAPMAMKKIILGAFDARDFEGVKRNKRMMYDLYYDGIRDLVPQARRLEYRLSDGWEPLCEFLGVEVPDVEFRK